MELIKPHGGHLVNRVIHVKEGELRGLNTVRIDERTALDLEQIAVGAYSPLEGFMNGADYEFVVERMRLSNYIPWSMPITLATGEDEAKELLDGDDIALVNGKRDEVLGILSLEEKFSYDKKIEAEKVYKTKDPSHPGVDKLYRKGDVLLGGRISQVNRIPHRDFLEHRLDPSDTRRIFAEKGWRTIIGFQTRNPIHRAHEYITKCALEMVDGLFIHPLVGATKNDDIPSETRMKCYESVIENYYPKDRVLLGIFPAPMRYAGPREAIFHAIVRKNYGCTHFTVGRDHAGVGTYYGPFDAQDIFYEFEACELGIVPLFFEHCFYCKKCGHMASLKTCPHNEGDRVSLSGSKVRTLLNERQTLPPEFARPEVSSILIKANGSKQTRTLEEVSEVIQRV